MGTLMPLPNALSYWWTIDARGTFRQSFADRFSWAWLFRLLMLRLPYIWHDGFLSIMALRAQCISCHAIEIQYRDTDWLVYVGTEWCRWTPGLNYDKAWFVCRSVTACWSIYGWMIELTASDRGRVPWFFPWCRVGHKIQDITQHL
jgi:hypothetical protein